MKLGAMKTHRQRVLMGLWRLHTDLAASNGSSTATVELGQEASDGEDSDPDAPCTSELDTVFDALVELAGEDGRD